MYDKQKADRVVRFINGLKHTKGEFYGKPFDLLPWQDKAVREIFGTVRDERPDIRQYTTAYIEIPKKQGKSELGAALALNMLCNDGEWRAEVYGCASDRQQASIIYDVAADMVDQCPALKKRIKLVRSVKRMIYLPTGGIYQVLSSEVATKHGLNVSACIFDELHTQPTRELYDVMTQGSGDARKQPLFLFLTTAGTDRNSICWTVHQQAIDQLEGRRHNKRFYPVVYGLRDGEDWKDEKNWYKANPSLGITIDIEKVRDAFEKALENPIDELMFRQLRLNEWVSASTHWMNMGKWDATQGEIDREALKGRSCYAGLDLSVVGDLTALALVFPPEEDDGRYIIQMHYWIPEEGMRQRVRNDHVPYDQWAMEGHIETTEGDTVDYRAIKQKIFELAEEFDIEEIAFDRWNSTMLIQELEDEGLTMVRMGQGYRDMSPPTKELYRMVMAKDICHDGHPVLRWNMENMVVKVDPAGNIKPDKEKSREKIDGAVALVMAMDRAIRNMGGSIYDDGRGLDFI